MFNFTSYPVFFTGNFIIPILICLFLGQVQQSGAQILNIERQRLEPDSLKPLVVKATFGINIYNRSAAEDSPVEMRGYNASLNSIYFSNRHTYAAIGQLDYLKINENPFLNFGFIHFRGHFFFKNKSSFEVFNQYSYDNFRGLDPRIIVGAGWRQKLLESDRSILILGMGVLYEWEKWKHPNEDLVVNVNLVKSTNYISYRFNINDYLDFNTITYYQVGYDDELGSLRNRISGVININSKISKRFSLTNSFNFSYEDKPVVPITRFIYQFRTGLSINF